MVDTPYSTGCISYTNKENVVAVVLESLVFCLEPATGAVQLKSCADEGDGNVVLSGQAPGQGDNRTNVGWGGLEFWF